MGTTIHAGHIRLKYSKDFKQVVIEPKDEDRFVISLDEAIRACRLYDQKAKVFRHQFDFLKNVVGQWVHDYKDHVKKTFLTLANDRLFLVVVSNQEAYDNELEESLTELDLRIAQDPSFSAIRLSVQILPLCHSDLLVCV